MNALNAKFEWGFVKRSVMCAVLGVAGLCLGSQVAFAGPATPAQVERVTNGIQAALGPSGVKVVSVEKVDFIDGLFEVVVNHNNAKKIVYSNLSGSHIVLGELLETKTMSNLTQAKADVLNAIDFDKDLPVHLALKTVYGSGSRKIAVFEDPNCGYCKRLRRESLSKLQDTTIYTFVYPVLGVDSVDKAQKVLCAANKNKMWEDWMLRDVSPSGKTDCNPPIAELVNLGRSMNVTGTPTIFYQDGTRSNGAILPSELHRRVALTARPK